MEINNKGFTLVELLAVIVILVSISLVAVGGISKSLERRDVKECEEQIQLAINAAKIYFSLEGGTSVSISTLRTSGYISEEKKVNRLSGSATIGISGDNYTYSGTCS